MNSKEFAEKRQALMNEYERTADSKRREELQAAIDKLWEKLRPEFNRAVLAVFALWAISEVLA